MRQERKFLVVSHVNPEGGAVGSLLGLALAPKGMGKDVTAYLEDPVPGIFTFLPGADSVVHDLEGRGPFDCTFAVDCGKKDRLGKGFVDLKGPGCIINLDHHTTNDRFGDINVIMPKASATGEVIYDLCKAASMTITPEIAVNLYVAIHTDTGSFRYSSTTPESLIKAGELLKMGVDPWEISTRVYENYPARRFKLLAKVLSTLEVVKLNSGSQDTDIATLVVTLDMMRNSEAGVDLADGFVNCARGIEGVEVGVLFMECHPREYKLSFRSKKDVNVSSVANALGGGGHAHAAGAVMKGTLEEVKAKVVEAIKKEI